VDGSVWVDDYRLSVSSYLSDVYGFWVINGVMDGGEEKYTTDILICFSEWTLWVIGGG